MHAQLTHFLQAFIPLFVAIDPIGLAALFLVLSAGSTEPRRQKIARQAVCTAAIVALVFLFLGQTIFRALGITVGDFQIAGGLVLLSFAVRDLVEPVYKPIELPDDFGVVPLGLPMIAGPAMLATVLVCAQTVGFLMTFLAMTANLLLAALAMFWSGTLEKRVGRTGLRAVSKIFSLLLAAIAVAMIRHGWAG